MNKQNRKIVGGQGIFVADLGFSSEVFSYGEKTAIIKSCFRKVKEIAPEGEGHTMLTVETDLEKMAKVDKNSERTEMFIRALEAETLSALIKFLCSSLFYDIGPVIATRIVTSFGDTTVQVIETSIEDLFSVRGVGRKRVLSVKSGWSLQRRLMEQSAELIRLKLEA